MTPRAALITGGSSGIGKSLARVLGQEGYAVTISGRDEAKLAAAAQELSAEGIAVLTAAGDVGDEEAVARIVKAHADGYGRMDALVNAAADASGGVALADLPTETLDRHLDVDLRAMFLIIRASLPMLTAAGAEHGKALVVNVSSLAAKGGTPGMSFYAAAKAGVNALTESAQAEARARRDPVHDLLAGLHRDADGGVDARRRRGARGDGAARGPRGGPAVPAAHLAHLPRARDRVRAAGPARDHRAPRGLARRGDLRDLARERRRTSLGRAATCARSSPPLTMVERSQPRSTTAQRTVCLLVT